MSIKYQRPSGAYGGASSLANRNKYQDDASATPKVAISSSKIDGDFNYILDALNEIDVASGVKNSIAERLGVSLNDDGTLRASVTVAMDDWVNHTVASLNKVGEDAITMAGDQSGIYHAGRRVRLIVAGAPIFGSIKSCVYATSITTLTLVDIVDADGNATVVSQTPASISYSPITVGSSGNSQVTFAEQKLRGEGALLRFVDNGVSGVEYAIRSNAGKLEFVENTGTESAPVWVVRGEVAASGMGSGTVKVSANDTTADGLENKISASVGIVKSISNEGSNEAVAIGVDVGTSANKIVQLDGNAKLPAVDASQLVNLPAPADDSVTLAKMATGVAGELISYDSSGNPTAINAGSAGQVLTSNGAGNVPSMQSIGATAKAWVTFDGTGSVAIDDSYGVSSITDNGTGNYTINFSTAFANTNYCGVATTRKVDDGTTPGVALPLLNDTKTTTAYELITTYGGGSLADSPETCAIFFGD